MKNITKLVSSLIIGGLVVSTQAQAADDMKVYVGAGIGYTMLNKNDNIEFYNKKVFPGSSDQEIAIYNSLPNTAFKNSSNNSFNGNVFAGVKLNQYFGVEAGYTRLFNAPDFKIDATRLKGQVNQSSLYADVLGYYPIADRTNLIGSLGIARVSTSVKYKAEAKANQEEKALVHTLNKEKVNSTNQIQPRIGVGVGYDVTDNIMVRGMLRHQASGLFSNSKKDEAKKELYKGATSLNVEVAYTF